VKLDKGDFVGRDALQRTKAEGLKRRLVGFEMLDRAPARDGYPVVKDGTQVGVVTSGSPAPYLKKNIGLAYLPVENSPRSARTSASSSAVGRRPLSSSRRHSTRGVAEESSVVRLQRLTR
jgi:glycine cleavage system aminomethyltransferase T